MHTIQYLISLHRVNEAVEIVRREMCISWLLDSDEVDYRGLLKYNMCAAQCIREARWKRKLLAKRGTNLIIYSRLKC